MEVDEKVKEIQGKSELYSFLQEFLQPYSDYKLNSIESGYLIDIDSLPYQFQFSCYPIIGWNVFLVSKSNELIDNATTNDLYEQFEQYIDQLNFHYYDLFPEEQSMVSERLETIKDHMDKTKEQNPNSFEDIHYKEPGVLQIRFSTDTCMTIGFSRIFKRWIFDAWNEQETTSVASIREYLQKQVSKWNQELTFT